jgi:hypothetical protein
MCSHTTNAGYDRIDIALDYLLAASTCTHFLVTNGDNLYSSDWLNHIQPEIDRGKKLIAWDFTSHHDQLARNNSSNVISVQLERGRIGLGAFLVHRDVIEMTSARFLPEAVFRPSEDDAGFNFLRQLQDALHDEDITLLHQVLSMHQQQVLPDLSS